MGPDGPRPGAATLVGAGEPEVSARSWRCGSPRSAPSASARNGGRLNGRLRGRALRAALSGCDPSARRRLIELSEAEAASGRGTERLLRVARTIADLAGDPDVARRPSRRGVLVPVVGPASADALAS